MGIIAVADVIKEDSPQAVRELQNMGIRVVMLTGDNAATAKAIAAQAGIKEYRAEMLPQHKAEAISNCRRKGDTWRWRATASTTAPPWHKPT